MKSRFEPRSKIVLAALALALAAGLGSVPIARQVSVGRHVHRRYEPGDKVRIGDVVGSVTEIGLLSFSADRTVVSRLMPASWMR